MTEIPERAASPDQEDESKFVVAARIEVNKLIKANRVNKIYRWLSVAVLVVLVLAVVALHQEDVNSCVAGNNFRTGQTMILNLFIGILITKKTPQSTLNIAHTYLAYVGQVDTLRGCGGVWP